MKKNISWQVLIVIGLTGDLVGRFTDGVIGDGIGVIGDICFLIGIANMIVALIKNRKLKNKQKDISLEKPASNVDKNLEKKYFLKYALFIVAISVVIIVAIFINSRNGLKNSKQNQSKQGGREFLFEKQTECMNICQIVYENHKKSLATIGTVFNPKYAYNETKNACFYSGGWVDSTASNTKLVINCQTNEEVLTFETNGDGEVVRNCNTCVNSSEEYNRREKEYMENFN